MSEGPLLRPEEVAGVLSGNPEAAAGPEVPAGPLPYSLREPVAVPPAAEAGARLRLEQLTAAIEQGLRGQLGQTVSLTVDGFQQQRAQGALAALPAPAWILCFSGTGGGAALAVSADTGLALVERALGGTGVQAAGGRPPTQLESRVMDSLAAAVAPAVAGLLGTGEAQSALRTGAVPASVAAPGETVGVGLLRIRVTEGERNGLILITAALLVAGAREPRVQPAPRIGPLAPLLDRVPVCARPVLRAGRLSVGEMAQLTVGTVVRLDAAETTPFDLLVGGQPLFKGSITRHEGRTVFSTTHRPCSSADAGKERKKEGEK